MYLPFLSLKCKRRKTSLALFEVAQFSELKARQDVASGASHWNV